MRKFTCYILVIIFVISMFDYRFNLISQAEDALQIRACWISYLDMETYLIDLDEHTFTQKVSEMYDKAIQYKFNTVIVHCRAMGDAMYPSSLFPWSIYISSDRGNPNYDPLEIMIGLAHEKGLRFEAWINPYRISRNNETTESYMNTEYYTKYKDLMIEYKDLAGEDCLVLDPSKEDTIRLITDGVLEVLNKYNVDGIHFDDYFYVDGMCDDLSVSVKMQNVNKLIENVYTTIKNNKPECTFGVSPAGNIESAKKQGADIDTWLSNYGYVDYLMPQIYWSDTYETNGETVDMFTTRSTDWIEVNKLDLPLYIGLALYKVDEPSQSDIGWKQKDTNIVMQYEKALSIGYDGCAIFRYEWLERESAFNELNNLCNYIKEINAPDFIRQTENTVEETTTETTTKQSVMIYGVGAAFIGLKK